MNDAKYEEILAMAMLNEIDAYAFYQGVANQSQDHVIKSIFQEMAEQELDHRDQLQSFLDDTNKTFKFKAIPDYKISETIDKPKLSLTMKPVDAVALIMKNEEEAMHIYQQFADVSDDAEQARIFQELAKMEAGHKAKLEQLYTNMAFPENW